MTARGISGPANASTDGLSTGWVNYALILLLGSVLAMNFVMTKAAVSDLPAGLVVARYIPSMTMTNDMSVNSMQSE